MKKLLNSSFAKTVLKFCTSGGFCTALDFIIYFGLCKATITPEIAKVISTTTACLVGFFINRTWTFLYQGKTDWALIAKYASAQVINILSNSTANRLALMVTNRNLIISFVFATACGMIVNFTLQKFWVFKEKKV